MPRGCRIDYTPEFLARLRNAYEQTRRPIELIARQYEIGERTLYRLAERERWVRAPRNLPPGLRALEEAQELLTSSEGIESTSVPPPHISPAKDEERQAASPLAVVRIAQLVESELAAAEAMRAQIRAEPCSPADAARIARTLATLAQTLQALQRLRAGPDRQTNDIDDMPTDIDAFRRELARRIDAFVASQTDDADVESDSDMVVDKART